MIHLTIKNRTQILFEGDVENISSYNKIGTIDILTDHANFISVIQKRVIFRQLGSTREIEIENALVKVKANRVSVYVGVK